MTIAKLYKALKMNVSNKSCSNFNVIKYKFHNH